MSEEQLREEKETLKHIIDNYAEWSIVKMHFVENRMSAKEILDGYIEKNRRIAVMDELKP